MLSSVRLGWAILGSVGLCSVIRLGYIMFNWVTLGYIRSDYVCLGYVQLGYNKFNSVRFDYVKFCWVGFRIFVMLSFTASSDTNKFQTLHLRVT